MSEDPLGSAIIWSPWTAWTGGSGNRPGTGSRSHRRRAPDPRTRKPGPGNWGRSKGNGPIRTRRSLITNHPLTWMRDQRQMAEAEPQPQDRQLKDLDGADPAVTLLSGTSYR